MAKIVVVGCKLPNGIILESPIDPSIKVLIRGANQSPIVGAEYATTEVDGDFWELWASKNQDFGPFASKAIFVAKNATEIVAVAKEYKEVKTDLEPLRTDGKDRRAAGVKKADKE